MLNTTPVYPFALLLTAGVVKELDVSSEESNAAVKASDCDSDEEWAAATNAASNKKSDDESRMIYLEVDGWITIKVSKKIASIILKCRKSVSKALELFVNNAGLNASQEENRNNSMQNQEALPLILMQILDVISNCLCAEIAIPHNHAEIGRVR